MEIKFENRYYDGRKSKTQEAIKATETAYEKEIKDFITRVNRIFQDIEETEQEHLEHLKYLVENTDTMLLRTELLNELKTHSENFKELDDMCDIRFNPSDEVFYHSAVDPLLFPLSTSTP